MFKNLVICTVFLMLWAGNAQATEMTLSFSDRTAQLAFQQQVTNYNTGRSVLGIRGLYNEEDDHELVSGSFNVLGPLAFPGLEFGAGVQGYYVKVATNSYEVGAAGVGALINFAPPTMPRASFSGSIYVCPQVFNTLDSEGLWDSEVSASFQIAPRASIIASYTKMKVDIENLNSSLTLDNTFRVGLTLGF